MSQSLQNFLKKLSNVSLTRYLLVFWCGVFLFFRTWETLVFASLFVGVHAIEVFKFGSESNLKSLQRIEALEMQVTRILNRVGK